MKIGQYEIKKIDDEHFEVTIDFSNGDYKSEYIANICSGDFETILSNLFIRPEITYQMKRTKPIEF